jgi:hypothetical protein
MNAKTQLLKSYLDNYDDEQKRGELATQIFAVDNTDGFSELSLYNDDEELIATASSKVNGDVGENGRRDHFNRKLAVEICLGRALHSACEAGILDRTNLCEEITEAKNNPEQTEAVT